jgi:hypothetical protein
VLGISIVSSAQDTTINLPKPVAREVVKDLLRYDSLQIEHTFLKINYSLLNQNSKLKDTIISDKNGIIELYKKNQDLYDKMISVKDNQLNNSNKTVLDLNKSLRVIKRKKTFTEFISGVVIVSLGYLIVKP